MPGYNISVNGTPRPEELANLLKHLIATLPGIKQMAWRMEREERPDYFFIRSYIGKHTIRKVVYSWRNIVNH